MHPYRGCGLTVSRAMEVATQIPSTHVVSALQCCLVLGWMHPLGLYVWLQDHADFNGITYLIVRYYHTGFNSLRFDHMLCHCLHADDDEDDDDEEEEARRSKRKGEGGGAWREGGRESGRKGGGKEGGRQRWREGGRD